MLLLRSNSLSLSHNTKPHTQFINNHKFVASRLTKQIKAYIQFISLLEKIKISFKFKTTPMAGTSSSSSKSTKSRLSSKGFTGVGNLIKLLPTGTVFLFQFLNPVLTNSGECHVVNKYLSGFLIGICGLSCCFSSFTDSYCGSDGQIHYGVATIKGLWPSTSSGSSVDLSKYKLRVGDFVHAFFSLLVFAALSLLDSNTVECFYPSFESTKRTLLAVLPPVAGAIAGVVFMVFPNTRHGIGYPSTSSDNSDD